MSRPSLSPPRGIQDPRKELVLKTTAQRAPRACPLPCIASNRDPDQPRRGERATTTTAATHNSICPSEREVRRPIFQEAAVVHPPEIWSCGRLASQIRIPFSLNSRPTTPPPMMKKPCTHVRGALPKSSVCYIVTGSHNFFCAYYWLPHDHTTPHMIRFCFINLTTSKHRF
jgi:hypothetical protein